VTEDPRQTRRNGSHPRTAQSRSARSGGGSSCHVLPGLPCAPADVEHEHRPPCTLSAGTCRTPPSARHRLSWARRITTYRTAVRGLLSGSRCVTRASARLAAGRKARICLAGGSCDVGGDDVGGVPVQGCPGPLSLANLMVVRESAWEAASCTSRKGTPASRAAVMNACRSVCGPTFLAIPARRATRRTIRPAACRSSRRPSGARKTGPWHRSPMARSIARADRGASGIVTTLPPLRVMTRVRCPRSRPRASISAPVASETRSPLRASREISACSPGGPSPAAPQQSAEFVAVQAGGVRLIVQPGTAYMGGRGVLQQLLLDGVPIEPGDRAQPAGDRGPGPAAGFQVPGEALDVRAAGLEQGQAMLAAPAGELAQVQLIRLAGQAGVAGQEPGQGEPLGGREHRQHGDEGDGRGGCGHRAPPGSG
jgi:hypothetical protein